MTYSLQTFCACHTNDVRAVGTQIDVHVLSTSQEQSLDVLRFTRDFGDRDVLSFLMIEQSLTVCGHRH